MCSRCGEMWKLTERSSMVTEERKTEVGSGELMKDLDDLRGYGKQ